MNVYIDLLRDPNTLFVLKILVKLLYVAVPILLLLGLWNLWITYRRTLFFSKQTYILLEIKVPRQVFKSPQAMEFFVNSLYQTGGEGTWYDKYWKGQTRPWFSLEIVSIDGGVHFFIWTRKGFKNLIEATLYSQFVGVEIFEVPDYTLPVSFDLEKMNMWGTEFELTKADPYPIKTYIDYGLDKDPKDEFKIDPLTPLIEFMSSIGRGHQIWLQIIIRAHKAEVKDPETGKMIDPKWAKGAADEIKKIHEGVKAKKDPETGKEKEPGRLLTKGESEKIAALERSVSKRGFDVGIRGLYIGEKDVYNQGNVGGITGGMMHYNSNDLNGFKPARTTGGKFSYPWQDRSKKKTNAEKKFMLDAYKHRGYFYNEWTRPYFVLNTEELATIFHLPNGGLTNPNFARVESRKAEAPPNIPL